MSARRMRDLEVTDKDLPGLEGVVATPTPLTAPELIVDDEAPLAIEGQPGREQWRRRAVGD
ncbi:MAG: hypothetical protein H0V49_09140 [Nocardioidaceae bacterium]|nr:hypothetical protein [Nocardioidaceae bacterium]